MFFIVILSLFVHTETIQVHPDSLTVKNVTGYHDYSQMTEFLIEMKENYMNMASLFSIGRSVEGRELWVLKIKAPGTLYLGSPHIKFVGNIHGNEPVGRELILHLAEYLLKNYGTDEEVTWILDRTNIYLLPSMNPDGFEKSKEGNCDSGPGRENGNFVDLNRSFPDYFKVNKVPVQPETEAITRWMSEVPFLLSASFHGGALVANYPFDGSPGEDSEELLERILKILRNGSHPVEVWNNLTPNERDLLTPRLSLTPDDDVFQHLADTYSGNHLTMHKGRTCNASQPSFPGGITNGAAWYSFNGGMQDYNYVFKGCMELTLEISCCKYPLSQNLPRLWNENKRAILELAKQAQMGVRGLIVDKKTSAYIPGAVLYIDDRNISFTSSKDGEFWRMLLPGNYVLYAEAKGYEKQSFPFTVVNSNSSYPTPTWLNVYLNPMDDLVAETSNNVGKGSAGSFHSFSSYFHLIYLMSILLWTNRYFTV